MKIVHAICRIAIFLVLFLVLIAPVRSQQSDTLRILSYNVDDLRSGSLSRESKLRSVMAYMKPQIIIAQGINDSLAYGDSFDLLTDESKQGMTPFLGPNRTVLIYDSTRVKVLIYNAIPTSHLTIDEFILLAPASMDTFIIASCQFVSGEDSAAAADRAQQSQALRVHLHQRRTSHIIVAGTLNYSSSIEDGFQWLTQDAPFGDSLLRNSVRDPIDTTGKWHHNAAFSRWHTYSSRVDTTLDTSGLVDRSDYILLSPEIRNEAYRTSSYYVVGNAGSRFGQSVTRNGSASNPLTESLMAGSRHLPVQVDLVFRPKSTGIEEHRDRPSKMELSGMGSRTLQNIVRFQPFERLTFSILQKLTEQQPPAAP